jgi:hypothetical protein
MRSHQTQRQSNIPRGRIIALLAAVFVSAAAAGCGSSGSGSNPDGSSPKDSGGSGGSTGSGGSSSTDSRPGTGGRVTMVNPKLSGPCNATADCGAGLTCLAATDKTINGVGGPAHGYCTIACADADMASLAACDAAGGICVLTDANSTAGICMASCASGGGSAAVKCGRRPDVSCSPLFDNMGNPVANACVPNCSQDSDCPTGRKCDQRFNFCVDAPHAGGAFGTHCVFDTTGKMDSCAGSCFPSDFDNANNVTASFCSRSCTVGYLNECDWVDMNTTASSGGPHGVCLPIQQNFGFGDLGFCFQLCDTAADCADQTDPNLVCDKSGMANIGHGVCVWGVATPTDGGAGQ